MRRSGCHHFSVAFWTDFRNPLDEAESEEIQTPKFVARHSYEGIPRGKTEIITSDRGFTESPTADAVDLKGYTDAEKEFHNLRWIAKRAVNLDPKDRTIHITSPGGATPYSETKPVTYTQEQQMWASYRLIKGFTAKDGTQVKGLLTDEMVKTIADRVVATGKSGVTVHLPHRIVRPRKNIENMLSVAYNHELAKRLTEYFDTHHKDLRITFSDSEQDKLLAGLSIQEAADMNEGMEGVHVHALSSHNVKSTVQNGRSTGSLLDRIVKQPIFDYSQFQPGDLVILTDDHVQAGGTFITWWHALRNKGVDVVALTALSTMPESKNLQADSQVLEGIKTATGYAVESYMEEFPDAERTKITQKFSLATDTMLARVGLSTETLSNREALTLIAYFIDGTKREQLEWFERLAKSAGVDTNIIERDNESLMKQAREPTQSPVALNVLVDRLIPRYTVRQL